MPLWCPPCQDFAKELQAVQDSALDQVQVIELLIENKDYGGGVVEITDQMDWATDLATTIPVLMLIRLQVQQNGHTCTTEMVGFQHQL